MFDLETFRIIAKGMNIKTIGLNSYEINRLINEKLMGKISDRHELLGYGIKSQENRNDFKFEDDLLTKHNITSKQSMKRWISHNHPDKNGDTQVFVEVMRAYKLRYP